MPFPISESGRVVAWDIFTGRAGTQNVQVWRPTATPDEFQLICENEIRAPGVYDMVGVDCNCGDRVQDIGRDAPTAHLCALACDDNPACVSFGSWEDSERAPGFFGRAQATRGSQRAVLASIMHDHNSILSE